MEVELRDYPRQLSRQSAHHRIKVATCFAMFLFLFIKPFNWLVTSPIWSVDIGESSVLCVRSLVVFTIFTAFIFSLTGSSYSSSYTSRHLLSTSEEETSAQSFLDSNVFSIVASFFMLMFMILRGNPSCSQSQKDRLKKQ